MTRFRFDQRVVRLLLAGKPIGSVRLYGHSCTGSGGKFCLDATDESQRELIERVVELDRTVVRAAQNDDPSYDRLHEEHLSACNAILERILTVDGSDEPITEFLLYEDWSVELRPHI